jgi:hypothetical protein
MWKLNRARLTEHTVNLDLVALAKLATVGQSDQNLSAILINKATIGLLEDVDGLTTESGAILQVDNHWTTSFVDITTGHKANDVQRKARLRAGMDDVDVDIGFNLCDEKMTKRKGVKKSLPSYKSRSLQNIRGK